MSSSQDDLRTIPALVKRLKELFTDVDRVIAVSDADITADNVPTLPLITVSHVKDVANTSRKSGKRPEITESILIEFWVKTSKFKTADGGQAPFWSYYDYENIRDRILSFTHDWNTPKGSRLTYQNMSIEVETWAVSISFEFEHEFEWCIPEEFAPQPVNYSFSKNIEIGQSPCCQLCEDSGCSICKTN